MPTATLEERPRAETAAWRKIVEQYETPSTGRALWQLADTLGPLVVLWGLMYWSLGVSWWLTLPLAVLAGLFLVRVFIFFHDCGHGSFFKSRRVNDVVGFITGLLCFTPYHHWRWEHAVHHATSGHLEKRGTGDIWTMTVREYQAASPRRKFIYRVARNPLVLFVIAPVLLFLVYQRFPKRKAGKRERQSVHWMNLAIVIMVAGMSAIFGFKNYLIIQVVISAVGGSMGVWMFYVQHQYEDAYWEHGDEWDYTAAALQGSSFYKLPRILQWFTGNIGFHHIHHLSARIPNYNLERCHRAQPMFQEVKPLTLLSSMKCLTFRLWDEQRKKMIRFDQIQDPRPQPGQVAG